MGIGAVLHHNYQNVMASIIWETTRTPRYPLLDAVLARIKAIDRNRTT